MARTKTLLANATTEDAAEVIAEARSRNWDTASIKRHGNAAIAAALGVKPTAKAGQQPVGKYTNVGKKVVGWVMVDGEQEARKFEGQLVRNKRTGSPITGKCQVEGHGAGRISERKLAELQNDGTARVWLSTTTAWNEQDPRGTSVMLSSFVA